LQKRVRENSVLVCVEITDGRTAYARKSAITDYLFDSVAAIPAKRVTARKAHRVT
jgi:hypothetical protein